MKAWFKQSEGSMTLEAALIMPFVFMLLFMLFSFLQISIAEVALKRSLSETTKQLAAHMYAIDVLYSEWSQTNTGIQVNEWIDKVKAGKEQAESAEQWIEDYAYLIPDPILEMLRWMLNAKAQAGKEMSEQWKQLAGKAFTPIMRLLSADKIGRNSLDFDNVHITQVTLPSLDDRASAYIGIVAEYRLRLPVPIIDKTIILEKRSWERVWIGH